MQNSCPKETKSSAPQSKAPRETKEKKTTTTTSKASKRLEVVLEDDTPQSLTMRVQGPGASVAFGSTLIVAMQNEVPTLRACVVKVVVNGTSTNSDILRGIIELLTYSIGTSYDALTEPERCRCVRMGCSECALRVEWKLENPHHTYPLPCTAGMMRAVPDKAHPLHAEKLGVRPLDPNAVIAQVGACSMLHVQALLRLQRGKDHAAAIDAPLARVVPMVDVHVQDVKLGDPAIKRWKQVRQNCPTRVFGDPTVDIEDSKLLQSMRSHALQRSSRCVLCRECEEGGVAVVEPVQEQGFRLHVPTNGAVPAKLALKMAVTSVRARLSESLVPALEEPYVYRG
jgi:hypothetical protein